MIKLISLSLGTALLLGLGGCASYPLVPTKLTIQMRGSGTGMLYAMKNSAGFEKCSPKVNTQYGYSIYGDHCNFQPKDVPEKVVIEYAPFMGNKESTRTFYGKQVWIMEDISQNYFVNLKGERVSQEEWARQGKLKEKAYINSLPPSAWRTFTIYPKQILKEYQGVTPQGGSATTSGFRKVVDYHLIVQPDSSIKTSAAYMYESSGEGWRN